MVFWMLEVWLGRAMLGPTIFPTLKNHLQIVIFFYFEIFWILLFENASHYVFKFLASVKIDGYAGLFCRTPRNIVILIFFSSKKKSGLGPVFFIRGGAAILNCCWNEKRCFPPPSPRPIINCCWDWKKNDDGEEKLRT